MGNEKRPGETLTAFYVEHKQAHKDIGSNALFSIVYKQNKTKMRLVKIIISSFNIAAFFIK